MERNKAKTQSLILSALIIALVFLCTPEHIGLYTGAPVYARILHPLFHASLLHAIINAWCLVSITFTARINYATFVASIIIPMTYPTWLVHTDAHIIGLSGMTFAMLGIVSMKYSSLYFWFSIVWIIVLGLLLPNISGGIHVYSFLVGCLTSILTTRR